MEMNPEPFFNFIQERYRIFLKKQAGEPRPWTEDDILDYYKFTNVFREDDRTTVWFRENVRDDLRDSEDIILATTVFRWFNRITTGEALFCQTDLENNVSAYSSFKEDGDGQTLHNAIIKFIGWKGPHVTGAYIIKTPSGTSKLNGVIRSCEHFWRDSYPLTYHIGHNQVKSTVGWADAAEIMFDSDTTVTLENAWDWLRKFSYLGDFMAYEIVTDLRFTRALERAPDILTWANAGPGAMRGLNRLYDRPLNYGQKKEKWNEEMRNLLSLSTQEENWSFTDRPLEMREIEHMLCEFDKYTRVDKGEGKPRGVYR